MHQSLEFSHSLLDKKSGEWRFCVDFMCFKCSYKTRYDRNGDTLDRLSNSHFYSTLEMASGYWELSLYEQDREKMSFAVPGIGTFLFNGIPYRAPNK